MHWVETNHCWIGRPRTPPHRPISSAEMGDDERLDLVWPYHFEELTDSDAYAYVMFERTREPRPALSDSEDN